MYCRHFFPLLLVLSSWLICSANAHATSIAVVYPEVREPYRGVFLEIARGMEEKLGNTVNHYVLTSQQSSTDNLIAEMKNDGIEAVVTLGRAGLAAAKPLSAAFPVVIGAALVHPDEVPQGIAGISLTPAPEVLFDHLKRLVPEIKQITVIYDPQQTAWEIEHAKQAAKEMGFTLNAQQAEDLQASSGLFRQMLVEIQGNSIALWLPRENAAMDEQTLLPVVLKEAWEKNFVVFSSNLDHVRKGALFTLYPDNIGMGRSLASLALQQIQQPTPKTIKPLQDLLVAVNLRTAEHLGLRFSSQTRREFAMVFPTP